MITETVRKDFYLWRCMYCGLGFSHKNSALAHVKKTHTKGISAKSQVPLRPSEQLIQDALTNLAEHEGTPTRTTATKLEIAREAGYLGSEQAAKQRVAKVLIVLENQDLIQREYQPITGQWAINLHPKKEDA